MPKSQPMSRLLEGNTAMRPAPAGSELRVEHRGKARSRLVLGVFRDLQTAGSAMLTLEERGFAPEDITLRITKENQDSIEGRRVFRDQRGRTYVARAPIKLCKVRAWQSGLGMGALTGAAIGALASMVASASGGPPVTIFGVAFYLDAVVAWALVGIGVALGGVAGALIGVGKVDYLAVDYDGCRALEGAIVGVAVHDDTEADAIERTFTAQGAEVVCAA
jgi:hypothetical protein